MSKPPLDIKYRILRSRVMIILIGCLNVFGFFFILDQLKFIANCFSVEIDTNSITYMFLALLVLWGLNFLGLMAWIMIMNFWDKRKAKSNKQKRV